MVKKGLIPVFSVEALKGKKVGVQRETVHDKYLTAVYGKDVEIVRFGSLDEAFLDVKAGRIDIVMADSIALMDGSSAKKTAKTTNSLAPIWLTRRFWPGNRGCCPQAGYRSEAET